MPESASPERRKAVKTALDRLSAAVDTIAADVQSSRQRAEQAESEYGQLREVVSGSGGAAGGDLEERLRAVAAENQRLRETLSLARVKAERLRRRLEVVEDEV